MKENEFKKALQDKGIILNERQLEQFSLYYETLISYNEITNLTTITNKEDVYLKHFYDSLSILFYHDLENGCKLCDVGSGAGFPSIPIKIVRPDINVTIIDSLGKRITFLHHLFKVLDLKNVDAFHMRAEEYVSHRREYFDVVVARAVAKLNILAEICIPLVKEKGHFIAMKGQSGEEELQEANKAINILGCKLSKKEEFNLPFSGGIRNIFIFMKNDKTPNKYPRNYSQIKNKPL
ncbi:MAG TPA: 16S rRNA (guanine(527)-N(7))-methyltransferase RsmG [Haloplasmataceae bacterium]